MQQLCIFFVRIDQTSTNDPVVLATHWDPEVVKWSGWLSEMMPKGCTIWNGIFDLGSINSWFSNYCILPYPFICIFTIETHRKDEFGIMHCSITRNASVWSVIWPKLALISTDIGFNINWFRVWKKQDRSNRSYILSPSFHKKSEHISSQRGSISSKSWRWWSHNWLNRHLQKNA